jgi:hypothetical protein
VITLNEHKKEQERIKNQTISEWIAEYFGEPALKVKIEQQKRNKSANYGVDY